MPRLKTERTKCGHLLYILDCEAFARIIDRGPEPGVRIRYRRGPKVWAATEAEARELVELVVCEEIL